SDANLRILENVRNSTKRLAEFAINEELHNSNFLSHIKIIANYAFEAEVLARKDSSKPNRKYLIGHLRSVIMQERLAPWPEIEQAAGEIFYALVDAGTPDIHDWGSNKPRRLSKDQANKH